MSEKKQSLIKDKNKIQLLMDKLDEKKNRAVKEAYIQVNKVIEAIFSLCFSGLFYKSHALTSLSIIWRFC